MPKSTLTITLSDAQELTRVALSKATEFGIAVAVSVVDPGGFPLTFARMDGSPLMAGELAQGKAYTAVGQGLATTVWDGVRESDPSFGGAIMSIRGFTPFGGGEPLMASGQLVGGVGVSGGQVAQDSEIAALAAAAMASLVGDG
jgi:glc operon protein GlcG